MNADPLREITEEDIRRYEEDGVVLLKGMFDQTWLKHLSEQIEVDSHVSIDLIDFEPKERVASMGAGERDPS